jgi:hypothetical protein
MPNAFDKLNLRPVERRLVIGIAIVVFIVLNIWFVWPHFKDWSKIKGEYQGSLDTLARFKAEIGRASEWNVIKLKFEKEGEGGMASEEAAVQLRRVIQNQATQSGIVPNGLAELPRATRLGDQFFEEMPIRMGFQNAEESNLIDFLYNLSKDRSMIRVKDLSVRPDPQQQKLQGDVTLAASYQKKSVTKMAPGTSTSTPKTPGGGPAKPATAKPAPSKPAISPTKSSSSAKAPSPQKPKPLSADVER